MEKKRCCDRLTEQLPCSGIAGDGLAGQIVRTIVDYARSSTVAQANKHSLLPDCPAYEGHVSGRSIPFQDAFGEGPEPEGTGRVDGVEEAAEGVEVMAGDDGALRRKLERKMRVAMVDDVEEVKFSGLAAQPSGIVDHTIPQPVRISCRSGAPQGGQPAHPVPEWGLKPLYVEAARALPLQVQLQHGRAMVHAGPALLLEVADKADADHALPAARREP